jgi:cyanophycinase
MAGMSNRSGAIALVGSGEYLEVMTETDRFLLETLGGPAQARVVLIPAASGLEPGMPEHWNKLGADHFTRLGAQVKPARLVTREDACDPQILHLLEEANFFYFSGGNPNYLIETFYHSPAWQIITRRHSQGAVLAGCSAGAMAFGGFTTNIRAMRQGQPPEWVPALGLLPGIITLPHFDRLSGVISQELFKSLLETAPFENGQVQALLGIDEDTALVRLPENPGANQAVNSWQVFGRQTVSIFDHVGKALISRPGDRVTL